MEITKSLHIWQDITKTWGEQINIHYEGKSIVGLDIDSEHDAISYIDKLIKRLEVYNEKLKDHYSIKPKSKRINLVEPKMSHIYLMKNIRNGYYKIGRSINPEYRERTLQSEAPEIEMIFASPLTYAGYEKKLHIKFKEKRIRGEWFSLNLKDIEFVKSFDYGT